MRSLILIALLVVAGGSILWLTGAARDMAPPDAVAVVGDQVVTADQFRQEYTAYLLQSGLQDELRLRRSFVKRMIDMRLLTLYARDSLGLEEDASFLHEMERARRKLLIEGYLREAVYDTITITSRDLEEMFIRVNTRLSASHLYAPNLAQAERLKERLDRGESFEQLAREVFADPDLAASGGSLGYFGFDEMDPAFEETAYNLEVGEISEPVQTETGYSIVRLDGRDVKPILTEYEFSTRKDRIETYVRYRKRIDARKLLHEDIVSDLAPVFESDALDRLAAAGLEPDAIPGMEDGMPRIAAHLSTGDVLMSEMLDEARFLSEEQRAAARDRDGMAEVLKGLVVRRELLARAGTEGIANLADFRSAMESARLDQLYQSAWEHFRETVRVPEDSIRSHFERHGEEFVVPERVRIREIVVESGDEARDLMRSLTAGNFAAMAARHSLRPGAERTGGDLGLVTREQLGMLSDPVFSAPPGTLLGPLEARGRYAIFLVGERQPPRPATIDEARGEIEARLRSDVVRAVVEGRIERIRRYYDIERFLDRAESIDLRTRVST